MDKIIRINSQLRNSFEKYQEQFRETQVRSCNSISTSKVALGSRHGCFSLMMVMVHGTFACPMRYGAVLSSRKNQYLRQGTPWLLASANGSFVLLFRCILSRKNHKNWGRERREFDNVPSFILSSSCIIYEYLCICEHFLIKNLQFYQYGV